MDALGLKVIGQLLEAAVRPNRLLLLSNLSWIFSTQAIDVKTWIHVFHMC